MTERLANNAIAILDGSISADDTSLAIKDEDTKWPFPNAGNFHIRIDDEIIIVGNRIGTVFSSLTRGAEGTTAASHASGVSVTQPLTAESLTIFVNEHIGATGSTGPVGATGTGNTGNTGNTGAQGSTGATGVGATGATGAQGPTGPGAGATGNTGPVGLDGLDGSLGPSGATGPAGITGATGAQGATGPAGGATGNTGPTGLRGFTGSTGPQGVTGIQGATGPAGQPGPLSIQYIFSTITADADPGSGKLRLSNSTQNASIVIRTSIFDDNTVDWSAVLDSFTASTNPVKGYFYLFKESDPTKWLLFTLASEQSLTNYRNFSVTNVGSSAANPFADTDVIRLQFLRAGDQGATGNTGVGATGATGVQGVQGATGSQGPSGPAGATGAGNTGATGPAGPTGPSAGSVPTGTPLPWLTTSAPAGFLLADGSAVSRSTYSTLFGVIGVQFGSGDGSTTFNLPDMRGRTFVGLGQHTDVATIGNNEGQPVATRRPKHQHSVTQSPHSHGYKKAQYTASGQSGGQLVGTTNVSDTTDPASISISVGPTTSGTPVDAPAYLVGGYWIIKT